MNRLLVGLSLVLATISMSFAAYPTGSPVDVHGKLQVCEVSNTNTLCDENGTAYQLRGMSSFGLLFGESKKYVNSNVISALHDTYNSNVYRAAMYVDGFSLYSQDYLSNESESKAKMYEAIDAAEETGIYVIVDWHILSDGNPNTNIDEAKDFFEELSSDYANSDHIIYEICNEPNDGNYDNTSSEWTTIKTYAETIIPLIIANDPDALIIVGTPDYSQHPEMGYSDPIDGVGTTNIMYAFHFYANDSGHMFGNSTGIVSNLKSAINNDVPVFVSEWGTGSADGNGTVGEDESDDYLDYLDDNNISWVNWSLGAKDEATAALEPGASYDGVWDSSEISESGDYVFDRLANDYSDVDYTTSESSSSTVSSSSEEISSSSVSSSSSTTTDLSDLVIEDFASSTQINYAPNVASDDLGYWYEFTDTYGTTASSNIVEDGDFDGSLTYSGMLVAEDANEYSFTGVGFDLYNSGDIDAEDKTTVDVTDHDGITVTYTSNQAVYLFMSEAMEDDGSGYYCLLSSGTNVTATCEWDDFKQASWETDDHGGIPTSALVGFKFQYKNTGTSSMSYSLEITDISFYGGTRVEGDEVVSSSSSSDVITSIENVISQNMNLTQQGMNLVLGVAQDGLYQVEMYSIIGSLVGTLHSGYLNSGSHTISMSSLAKGVYFVKVISKNNLITQKVLIK